MLRLTILSCAFLFGCGERLLGTLGDPSVNSIIGAEGGSGNMAGATNTPGGAPHAAGAGAAAGANAAGCVVPTRGMVLSSHTTLCGGSYPIDLGLSRAAITVRGTNLVVKCDGTELVNVTERRGLREQPSSGFFIDKSQGVTLIGCSAHGFGYGVLAANSRNVSVESGNFDYLSEDLDFFEFDNAPPVGVRFERVQGGTIKHSSVSHNWNGIELHAASEVKVESNTADACFNIAAVLSSARNNKLYDNRFSFAALAIQVSAGSDDNEIESNQLSDSVSGLQITPGNGRCPERNRVAWNQVRRNIQSGIEGSCDHTEFVGNLAAENKYGLLLGGAQHGKVLQNIVEMNALDGISIQGVSRHTLIEGNQISGNGRVGLLISGRKIPEPSEQIGVRDSVGRDVHASPDIANASHIAVQRNRFEGNHVHDVLATSASGLFFASNCLNDISVGHETYLAETFTSSCQAVDDALPLAAQITGPELVRSGSSARYEAILEKSPASQPSDSYSWLVAQAGKERFANGHLPEPVLASKSGSYIQTLFPSIGFYDIDLTPKHKMLASLATKRVVVTPAGVSILDDAARWLASCAEVDCQTELKNDVGLDAAALHVSTKTGTPLSISAPRSRDLAIDPSQFAKLAVFVKAKNLNEWQGRFPVIVLGSEQGKLTYTPTQNLLPSDAVTWIAIELELHPSENANEQVQQTRGFMQANDGSSRAQVTWERVAEGSLHKVDFVEIQADTWNTGFELWIDALAFYN